MEELLRQLDAQRDAYLDTLQQLHASVTDIDIKANNATDNIPESANPTQIELRSVNSHRDRVSTDISLSPTSISPMLSEPSRRRYMDLAALESSISGSISDDSENEGDDSYYVRPHLPSRSYDYERLRDHLNKYAWDDYGREILSTILSDAKLLKHQDLLNHIDAAGDKGNYSLHQVFYIGEDGVPILVETATGEKDQGISKAIRLWHAIKVCLLSYSSLPDAHRDPGCQYR
jgi:hypothetical protein